MKRERTMEQAIQDYAAELAVRKVTETHARELYDGHDERYRRDLLYKSDSWVESYIRREGCALYLKERYGVDLG